MKRSENANIEFEASIHGKDVAEAFRRHMGVDAPTGTVEKELLARVLGSTIAEAVVREYQMASEFFDWMNETPDYFETSTKAIQHVCARIAEMCGITPEQLALVCAKAVTMSADPEKLTEFLAGSMSEIYSPEQVEAMRRELKNEAGALDELQSKINVARFNPITGQPWKVRGT